MTEEHTPEIIIPDITRLDQLELSRQLGPDKVRFEAVEESSDQHGELATTVAVVIVTLAALKVLATYLAKKHNRESFARTVMLRKPNGEERTETIRYNSASGEPPDAEILKQLAKVCDVDIQALTD
jgi:hypothetical protein